MAQCDPFHAYAQAKAAADAHLRSSGLDWTILAPANPPSRNQPEPSTSQGSFPRRRFTG
ncbi:NAD(P)H-binding protein [Arachnia propionica]|uniref:NAD(P)H-binding protein n=1 Tax=Arachnia propionica TaxID=1750 RepID=UPI003C6F7BB1